MRKILTLALILCIGCYGTFSRDQSLKQQYKSAINDQSLGIFYTITQDSIELAIRNIGDSFMENLKISINCEVDGGEIMLFKYVTDLHIYNNKSTKYFFRDKVCSGITLSYTYTPNNAYGFEEKRELPAEDVSGVLSLK